MTTTAPTSSDEMVVPANMLPVQVTGMQAMASKMWMPLIGMGFMIVFAAFIFGLFNSSVTSDYFDASKADRDAAVRDSDLATDRAFIESTKVWLPTLKFLGMGMILSGVTFLLATILGALRVGGAGVQQALGETVRMPKPPVTAQMFPMLMMLGLVLLVVSLIIGVILATLSYDYWNNSIVKDLAPALENSGFLDDLKTINSTQAWLIPIKFLGIAFLLSGIGLALATIVRVLRWQSTRLWDMLSESPGNDQG